MPIEPVMTEAGAFVMPVFERTTKFSAVPKSTPVMLAAGRSPNERNANARAVMK